MTKMNQILLAAIVATAVNMAGPAKAQFKLNEEDGIAASPKVRQILNERKAPAVVSGVASKSRAVTTVASPSSGVIAGGIAASPKTHQVLNEFKRSPAAAPASPVAVSVAYQPTGVDGITASPKLRQQLNERPAIIMVAPVK